MAVSARAVRGQGARDAGNGNGHGSDAALQELRDALIAAADGDFTIRLDAGLPGTLGEISKAYNDLAEMNGRMTNGLQKIARVVGREGRMTERLELDGAHGSWSAGVEAVNSLTDDLVRPTTEVARVIVAVAEGDLSQKMALKIEGQPVKGEFLRIGTAVNTMVDQLSSFSAEVTRVAKEVGTEGKLGGQAKVEGVSGTWKDLTENVNQLASNLTNQVRNIAQVTTAVAGGDLSQKITVDVKGEIAELKNTINTMVDQLGGFADEVTRVAREVGTDGKLGGQAVVPGVAGTWKDLTDSVNFMAGNLTAQVRNIAQVTTAVAKGDLSQKITVDAEGEVAALAETINTMVDQLRSFADEVTRVAKEVGTEGRLGGQAKVPGVSGTWKDLTENVNQLASNLTNQVRNIAQVTTAVAKGDLSQKITVDAKGEVAALADTINTMVDQLRSFAAEVTRVAREVGTEGKLGGQAQVEGVSGTWKDLTENVNQLASNLTNQVRNIAQVTTAVAQGDLSQKITVDAKGEVAALAQTINTMVDQLRSFAAEVTRVAREVGTEGRLGGQAQVEGVSGTWKDLTENVNQLASNLTNQVRNIAQVTTAVARGDLSQKITVDVKGEIAELKNTINTMVDQLRSFADEVTRVAREVGTEGQLGGQAEVEDVSGTWKKLTDNVNFMAGNLTTQVRAIAAVTTAVANGDLTKKITVDAQGEILELKDTINTMVDQLGSFADEVTRVAKEVGTEGKLGGQARVEGVSGTWKGLTENVNQLASNLTTQVRAIAEVSTAVTSGDLTRQISVEAQGEVAELKDNINQMIANLRDTTQKNAEQDWLKSNLARIGGMLQGQRDITTVSRLIMSEVTPLVSAQYGAFFLSDREMTDPSLDLVAGYGVAAGRKAPKRFAFGEGLVGQTAVERKNILLTKAPADYIKISSGLGEAAPVNVIVLPILFEEEVLGVIELASFQEFSPIYRTFLDQLMGTIGVVINTIIANMRTEALLEQSQRLTRELQVQQDELKRSNSELEAQAKSLTESELLLHRQQQELQQTNSEIEAARLSLEEKAEQLAVSSKYKSEFLANMSHELRTPLNSVLILAKLLADNAEGNLSDKQINYARTIHAGGSDLLSLISDILDLSKVEAGKMDINPAKIRVEDLRDYVDLTFRPVAAEKSLNFVIDVDESVPATITTDEQRLQQILKNLLSNAFKFTSDGGVTMSVRRAEPGHDYVSESLQNADTVIAFSVEDTGIGVAPDKLKLIFEAFQQADGTTSRKFGGTGLGLSISREIARLLGAEIQVESRPGEGSTFTVYMPATFRSVEARPATEMETATRDADRAEAASIARLTGGDAEAGEELIRADHVPDDRDDIAPGDSVALLVVDPDTAEPLRDEVRRRGHRALIAARPEMGLDLARQFRPTAVLIATSAQGVDGVTLLARLKHDMGTRHVPVALIGDDHTRAHALAIGAATHLEGTVDVSRMGEVIDSLRSVVERERRRVLVVDDDEAVRFSVGELISAMGRVDIVSVGTGAAAEEALAEGNFDCMVLDLGLPDEPGLHLLEALDRQERYRDLPIVVFTGRELQPEEELRLRQVAQSIVIKDAHSLERLIDELSLFLHIPENELPASQREMLSLLHHDDAILRGRKILIVDDDVRNVFALTSALEEHGLEVVFAENGRRGIERLQQHPDVSLVLMDIMMPEMDGYQTTRAIRSMSEFDRLPIIALTAKAMKGDREKSIASGASDYITKPVEVEQLLSLMRMWLHRRTG
jgi:HAMP domain-containing protein/signal transduction histidine kinase/CheY-like chemotaxis protein